MPVELAIERGLVGEQLARAAVIVLEPYEHREALRPRPRHGPVDVEGVGSIAPERAQELKARHHPRGVVQAPEAGLAEQAVEQRGRPLLPGRKPLDVGEDVGRGRKGAALEGILVFHDPHLRQPEAEGAVG